jgi:hypothetical protein
MNDIEKCDLILKYSNLNKYDDCKRFYLNEKLIVFDRFKDHFYLTDYTNQNADYIFTYIGRKIISYINYEYYINEILKYFIIKNAGIEEYFQIFQIPETDQILYYLKKD